MALQTTTFTQRVKTLIELEEEIHLLQDQLRERRKQKQQAEEEIMATMVERKWNKIDAGKCILSISEKKTLFFVILYLFRKNTFPDYS